MSIDVAPIGPVSVAARPWTLRGRTFVTAIVKATFSIVHDRAMELAAPRPIVRREVQRRADPLSSIEHASDLALTMPMAQIIVNGVAFSPDGKPAPHVEARVAVARGDRMLLSKRLTIVGDRLGRRGEKPPPPAPLTEMPVVYERALGGLGHAHNPSGRGVEAQANGLVPLPNIHLGEGAHVEPAGFGPISARWPARRKLRPDALSLESFEQDDVVVLPDRFDETFFFAAPEDQRLPDLKAGDLIAFSSLHPSLTTLRTYVPQVAARGVLETAGGRRVDVPLRLDTLHAEPHHMVAELVYRGAVEVPHDALAGLRVAGLVERDGEAIGVPDLRSVAMTRNEGNKAAPRFDPSATAVLEPAASEKRNLERTLVIEPEPPPARPAKVGTGTLLIEPPAPLPSATASPKTIPMPPELPKATEPPPAGGPLVRRATLELEPDASPASLPFDRRPKRSRSSATRDRVNVAGKGVPGAPWSDEPAPAAKRSVDLSSTMVIEEPAPEEAPRSSKARSRRSASNQHAIPRVATPVAPPPNPSPVPPLLTPRLDAEEDAPAPIEPGPSSRGPRAKRAVEAQEKPKGDFQSKLYKKIKR